MGGGRRRPQTLFSRGVGPEAGDKRLRWGQEEKKREESRTEEKRKKKKSNNVQQKKKY